MAGFPAKLLLLASTQVTHAAAGCSASGWYDAYGGERCYNNGDVMDISCNDKFSGDNCGARLMHADKFGIGEIALSIKAAPGDGVVTSFYLSNNGGMYVEGGSWSEIDFEIMGKQATGGGTQIWTNYFAGSTEEHHGFVSVPFDVSAEAHVYSIRVNFTHIQWVVDGNAIRTDDYTAYPDMSAAVHGNTFQGFASVWGKSYADPNVGCQEFLDGTGKLDDNPNGFPVHATFQPVDSPPPAPQAKFQIGHFSAGAQRTAAAVASVLSAAAAATALTLAAVAAVRRRRPVSEQEEPLASGHAKEDHDSI